ncbi:RnfABCDGE type electron transport complex subunit A [Candidatus Woesearchaeota archaeon]|nr:RnfABCDGE type electron transport complex subunit A [Candidatus Woesearchaeota archaeon]
MNEYLAIIIGAIFVNNFVLHRFLGMCPFIGVSKTTRPAIGMGVAVTLVMTLVSMITWPLYHYVLLPFGLEYMHLVIFILIIASFVQILEIFIKKHLPTLFDALGIYLPLITTNCAILGVALINITAGYSYLHSIIFGMSAGLGFMLALLLMSAIRERLDLGPVPKPFKGPAIAFITAAMMSMAFMVFSNIKL